MNRCGVCGRAAHTTSEERAACTSWFYTAMMAQGGNPFAPIVRPEEPA